MNPTEAAILLMIAITLGAGLILALYATWKQSEWNKNQERQMEKFARHVNFKSITEMYLVGALKDSRMVGMFSVFKPELTDEDFEKAEHDLSFIIVDIVNQEVYNGQKREWEQIQ